MYRYTDYYLLWSMCVLVSTTACFVAATKIRPQFNKAMYDHVMGLIDLRDQMVERKSADIYYLSSAR